MKKVVNAIILNQEKIKFLIVKRKNEKIHPDKWLFPGGVMEKEESVEQTLMRELKEEVGLELKKIIRKISSYDYLGENKEMTKGESYLVETENKDVIIGFEIDDLKWVTIEEFENLDYVQGMDGEAMRALFGETWKHNNF